MVATAYIFFCTTGLGNISLYFSKSGNIYNAPGIFFNRFLMSIWTILNVGKTAVKTKMNSELFGFED